MTSTDDTQLVQSSDFIDSWRGAAVPESGDVLVGVTLNSTYAVERLLGEGGMGRVYLARHTRIAQKRVAVKVLHTEFSANQQVLARFQREAEAAAAVSHPNVVAVLDVDTTPQGMPYMVCEYLEGVDLSDHLREVQRLDVADALSVTRQLCRGLGAAHARGVIHRDLKPPNVFLVGDFSKGAPPRLYAKVLDFGLSRFRGSQGEQNLTKTGFIMGTPTYMAPEQARGQQVDHRADVYGLGTILYTMLTGRPPFQEESPQATILAVLSSEPPRPRSLVPTIPPHIELVIERAMAKKPEDRFANMEAFEAALDALPAAHVSRESLQPAPLAAPTPSSKRLASVSDSDADVHSARPRLVLSLIAAVLLLVCAALVAVSGLELATGHIFSQFELRLLLLGVAGTALTPALLWFLHVRRRIWENSSRVLSLLVSVRAAVLGGIISYGLFVLGFHLIDDFLVRFLGRPDVTAVGATWQGWNMLLPAASLVLAIAMGWRRRLLASAQPGFRRLMMLWLVTSVALVLSAGIVRVGLAWRGLTLGH
jgi:serine/threonine-protein kinase